VLLEATGLNLNACYCQCCVGGDGVFNLHNILSDNTYSHTAYCRVLLIDLYLYIPNFVQIEKKLCGRGTDVRIGGRTY